MLTLQAAADLTSSPLQDPRRQAYAKMTTHKHKAQQSTPHATSVFLYTQKHTPSVLVYRRLLPNLLSSGALIWFVEWHFNSKKLSPIFAEKALPKLRLRYQHLLLVILFLAIKHSQADEAARISVVLCSKECLLQRASARCSTR